MTFFTELNSGSAFDSNCAKLLHDGLKKAGRLRSYNHNSWTKWFANLRRHHSANSILKVLSWYVTHIDYKFAPHIYSAKAFKFKFESIKVAMERYVPEGMPLTITDDARYIHSKVNHLHWPNKLEEASQLLSTIQTSLNQYITFLESLTSLHQQQEQLARKKSKGGVTNSNDWRVPRLLEYLISALPAPIQFVELWIIDVWKIAWHWDKWDGNLQRWAFHPSNKRFQKRVRGLTTDYCGDATRWEEVQELL